MSTIKNGKIWLYFHFTAVIKGCGASFQSVDFTKTHKSRYIENETIFFFN